MLQQFQPGSQWIRVCNGIRYTLANLSGSHVWLHQNGTNRALYIKQTTLLKRYKLVPPAPANDR